MTMSNLYQNYCDSLKQKYNAVCFDIDGTLTIPGSKSIDKRAVNMIISLLKRKVPVVFITGRGESGLHDFKEDIFDELESAKNKCILTENDLKRLYVLTNDGARLFCSKDVSKDTFLKECLYHPSKKELHYLEEVDDYIRKLLSNPKFDGYFKIIYSEDSSTKKILNIRLQLEKEHDSVVEYVFNQINDYINNKYFNNIHLTRGIYKEKTIFQIGTATKDKAIEKTEMLIGVPKNSMMRIGDCGDERGNDYSMLNCSQGYSVDKVSKDENSCFPIFDDDGNILTGVEATLHLVKKAKILPTVCLEKAYKESYKHNFAIVERGIVNGRQKLLKKYNNKVRSNFSECTSIDDLFDSASGSIMIPMYEMEYNGDSALKDFWLSQNNNALAYSIRDDNSFLLRGADTYYYFLANRMSVDGNDITTKEDVIEWHNNYIRFLEEAMLALYKTSDINYQTNKKFILGILDNCRNILLVLLNHYLVTNYHNKNALLDISSNNDERIKNIYDTLINVESLMGGICFRGSYVIKFDDIVECIEKTKDILNGNLVNEINSEKQLNYSKDYRAYREIDNFAQNYIAVSLYDNKCGSKEYISACGLSYGGTELPIIAKVKMRERVERASLLQFSKEVSGYANKQLIELRKFDIDQFGGLINSEEFKDSKVGLFDDNVLTGKTLQLAINALYDKDIGVQNICVVRYPGTNRIDQMFIDQPSAVDYKLFFNFIYGLCFPSPYTHKDNNWTGLSGIDYTDSLGIFDLNRKKIIECLLKNHKYNERSEVGEYKRRLIR